VVGIFMNLAARGVPRRSSLPRRRALSPALVEAHGVIVAEPERKSTWEEPW
jgi:hypothetical protein